MFTVCLGGCPWVEVLGIRFPPLGPPSGCRRLQGSEENKGERMTGKKRREREGRRETGRKEGGGKERKQ